MSKLKPATPRFFSLTLFVSKNLEICSYVFARGETSHASFQYVYDRPFQVLSRKKHFTIQRSAREDTISIDRFKPTFLFKSNMRLSPDTSRFHSLSQRAMAVFLLLTILWTLCLPLKRLYLLALKVVQNALRFYRPKVTRSGYCVRPVYRLVDFFFFLRG